ncbi:MAG: tRNA pseudouridine(55) synthase TruB [Gemmatimonadota bacterium]
MISAPVREGLLPVDKPIGPTSHDIVARARRELGLRRIGHTGTLDPFASGLLLLLLGNATRLAQYLDHLPKEYVAVARLGVRTTTDDLEGEELGRSEDWRALDTQRLAEVLDSFAGESEQLPPQFSAKKVGGNRAYQLARTGEEVALAPSRITIHEIQLEKAPLPEVHFRVRCSTGTYIRALARDLGDRLGVGAHLTALRRTAIGPFRAETALPLNALGDASAVSAVLVPPLVAVGHLPIRELDGVEAGRIRLGQAIPSLADDLDEGCAVALASEGQLVAVGVTAGELIRPRKVFQA